MKENKFILIILIITLLAGAIGLFSLFTYDKLLIDSLSTMGWSLGLNGFSYAEKMDYNDVYDDVLDIIDNSELTNYEDPMELEVGDFSLIESKNFNGGLEILKSDTGKAYINLYYRGGNPLESEDLSYQVNKETLTLKSKPGASFKGDYLLQIYSPNPNLLKINIDNLNGVLSSNELLNSIDIHTLNGALNLNSDKSYNVSIGTINGVANIYFVDFSAYVDVKKVNGGADIYGEILIPTSESFEIEFIGEGEMVNIDIGTVNGGLNIQ